MTSKATALPWKKILMCASVALANYFSLAVVYPFLPFMVSDFFPLLPPSELGSRTGFLGASFNVGQLIGSLVWGRLSDRYGRRPIMLAGCLGTIVCVSGFMFSVNFYMALAMRFLWGLSNGNIGVCKTYLSEICDDSNQARGFAYFEALGGIGWLAGPAIGGILSQPTVHWPGVFPDLFDQFRYLLPCTIALCIATTSFVLAFKYLEETLHLSLAVAEDEQNETQLESLGDTKNGDDGKLLTNDAAGTAESEGPEVFMPATPAGSSFMSVLKQRNCIIACLCYAVLGLCVEMLEEVYPLWTLLSVPKGFGFRPDGIGFIMMACAPVQILLQLFAYPRAVARFGTLKVFRAAAVYVGIEAFFMPFASIFGGYGAGVDFLNETTACATSVAQTVSTGAADMTAGTVSTAALTASAVPAVITAGWIGWLAAYVVWMMQASVWVWIFISTFILIGNSVHPHERGTINGIAQSMVAVSRIVGPIAAAAVFAATASGDRAWPLDYHLIFHIVGVLFLCLAFLSTQFKGDVQKKKPLIQTASSRRRQRRRDMPAVDAGADDQSLITNDAIEETTTSVQ